MHFLPKHAALKHWSSKFLLVLIGVVYLAISLDQLAVFPPIHQDEPWLAAAPYKLATEGTYGSDLFTGYYGSEQHLYQMPVYSLLLAGIFKVAGLGVFQMRLLPVLCGLVLLGFTFAVGRQAADERAGLLAALLLVSLRLAAGWDETGIPLLDLARINRYDIAVPVFGLAALWMFNHAEQHGRKRNYFFAGLLTGLSSLSHLYGAFWLPALVLVMFLRRGLPVFRSSGFYLVMGGFLLPWLPWMAYIATGWSDFLGQHRFVAERFDLLDPHFYVDNLLQEFRRYRPLVPLDAEGNWHVLQFGTWVAISGVLVALGAVLRRRARLVRTPVFALAVTLIVKTLLFALLLIVKAYHYVIALWPLAVLLLAWLGICLWDHAAGRSARFALLAVLLIVVVEGSGRVVHRRTMAAATTPYAAFEGRIRLFLRPGERVVGLQHYWIGLHDHPYRSWLLPILLADSLSYHAPLPLDEALARVAPDIILLDRDMNRYFDEIATPVHRRHAQYVQFHAYMRRHGAAEIGVVSDSTYGTMRIYRINKPE